MSTKGLLKCEKHNIRCGNWTGVRCQYEPPCPKGFDGESNCDGRGLKEPPPIENGVKFAEKVEKLAGELNEKMEIVPPQSNRIQEIYKKEQATRESVRDRKLELYEKEIRDIAELFDVAEIIDADYYVDYVFLLNLIKNKIKEKMEITPPPPQSNKLEKIAKNLDEQIKAGTNFNPEWVEKNNESRLATKLKNEKYETKVKLRQAFHTIIDSIFDLYLRS